MNILSPWDSSDVGTEPSLGVSAPVFFLFHCGPSEVGGSEAAAPAAAEPKAEIPPFVRLDPNPEKGTPLGG